VATARLDEGPVGADRAFYEGKVAAASFFARTVLPGLSAERQVPEATDLAVMDVDDSGF